MSTSSSHRPFFAMRVAAVCSIVGWLAGLTTAVAQDGTNDELVKAVKNLVEVVGTNLAVPEDTIPAVIRFGSRRGPETLVPGALGDVNGTVRLSRSVLESGRDADLFLYGVAVKTDIPHSLPEGIDIRKLAKSFGISKKRILLGRLNVRFDKGLQFHVATAQIDPDVLGHGMASTVYIFSEDLGDEMVPDDPDSMVFAKLADAHVGRAHLAAGHADEEIEEALCQAPVVGAIAPCWDFCIPSGPANVDCDCRSDATDPWYCPSIPGNINCVGACF